MSGPARAALLGHPVAHSKSPLIHNYWIEKYHKQGRYEAFDVAPAALAAQLHALCEEGYTGFNFTLPHKEAALALCDEADETARATGAVNTAWVEDGRLKGTNTDVFGFVENIRQACSRFDFKARPAVVLGAGGAAKAVVYALIQAGAPEIRVFNRTRSKAQMLARTGVRTGTWEERGEGLKGAGLLVNATNLGMAGQRPLGISLTILPRDALVTDIVYAPLKTDLLERAAARGNPVAGGIGMLLHQARPAFAKWFGIMPQIDPQLLRMVSA